ncbi:MAG: NUDIX hydrolase [Bacteroidota bacterium]
MKFCPWCGKSLVVQMHGDRERKMCPDKSCGFIDWNNPTPVVAAIVEKAGKVVLVRSIGWPPGWYGLVTGFLEAGETTEEGVLREVKEEIGLDVEMGGLIGLYPFYRMNQLLIVYHVIAPDLPIALDTSELEGFKEVPIDQVQPWDAGTGIGLRDWLRTKGFERELISLRGRGKR